MITEAKRLYTAEEYGSLPADEDGLTELIDGEIVEVPSPASIHSLLAGWILTLFNIFVVPRKLGVVTGEQGAYLLSQNPDTVRQPDVAFMRRERVKFTGIYYTGGPDIVVEVVSPGNSMTEMRDKMNRFFAAGTTCFWLVYMESRHIDVFTAGGATTCRMGDTIHMGAVLPGFTLTLDEIFSILEPNP